MAGIGVFGDSTTPAQRASIETTAIRNHAAYQQPELCSAISWSEGGFRRDVIATDDHFTSVAQAAETTGFLWVIDSRNPCARLVALA